MLAIQIYDDEFYNEETNQFIKVNRRVYHFEHSLLSIAEWESKYQLPFFSVIDNTRLPNITPEQMLDYIIFMNIDNDFDPDELSTDNVVEIWNYIGVQPTATVISKDDNDSNSRRVMTSEVIYAYMANAQVPYSCETWNVNRLLTLIGVIGEFNKPKKKMTEAEQLALYKKENERRLAEEKERRNNENNPKD